MSKTLLYSIVLLSALAHAAWNALLKGSHDRLVTLTAFRIVGLCFGVALLPFVQLPAGTSVAWLIGATLAHYAYYALLIQGYRAGDLSFVYPLARGAAPLILTLVAFLTIGETLAGRQVVAVAIICAGVGTLAFAGGGSGTALAFALLTGSSIAAYSFLGGVGVRASGSLLGFAAVLEIATGLGMIAFALGKRGPALLPALRSIWPIGFGAGIISVAAYITYLLAVTHLPLGPVAAVRECSALFGVLIGVLALKEGFGIQRAFATTLMTIGIVLLAVR